jgi:hypothetical protein
LLGFGNLTTLRARQILLRVFISFGLVGWSILQEGLIKSVLRFLRALILNCVIGLRDEVARCCGQSEYRDCSGNA